MFVLKREYIVYPPEGPRPQSPEELREMAREMARKRGTQSWGLYSHNPLGGDILYAFYHENDFYEIVIKMHPETFLYFSYY